MSKISQLEGSPWHQEKLPRKDDRRHKHNCMYFSESKCLMSKSACYGMRCGGSTHCSSYKEVSEDDRVKRATEKQSVVGDEIYWFD